MTPFDKTNTSRFNSPIAEIFAVGFDSLKPNGVRFAVMFFIDGIFVPFFHQLVGWVQGEKSRRYCLLVRSINLHSARLFSFDSDIGEHTKGASL